MLRTIGHKSLKWLVAALTLTLAGCSLFISTPQVARYHIQQPDDRFVEVVIHLDTPAETDLDIHINNRYILQLEFDWLWNQDEPTGIYTEFEADPEAPRLTPWMTCKYRF